MLFRSAFLQAFRALGSFAGQARLSTWLHRIAINAALMQLRRRRRTPEQSIEPLVEQGRQWGVDDDPATHAAASERDAQLRACFARLSPEHQAVLALRVMQDLPYDAIATALGVPVGTVMSRLSRARAELRRLMTEGSGESS